VAKPELGIKRICGNCGTKFYDLNRIPIICPKCQAVYQEAARSSPPAAKVEPAAAPEAALVKEGPVLVSLEEAEKEQTAAKQGVVPAEDDDFEIEDEPLDDDDDSFLEEAEEEDEDVTGLIGGGLDSADEEI